MKNVTGQENRSYVTDFEQAVINAYSLFKSFPVVFSLGTRKG